MMPNVDEVELNPLVRGERAQNRMGDGVSPGLTEAHRVSTIFPIPELLSAELHDVGSRDLCIWSDVRRSLGLTPDDLSLSQQGLRRR